MWPWGLLHLQRVAEVRLPTPVAIASLIQFLGRFLPDTCPERIQVLDDDTMPSGYKWVSKGRAFAQMDLAMWSIAWDRFSLAAVLTKQVSICGCACLGMLCMVCRRSWRTWIASDISTLSWRLLASAAHKWQSRLLTLHASIWRT